MANNTGTPSSKWKANGEPDPHGNAYDCERAALAMGNLTDDELANGAFLNYDIRPPVQDIIDGKASSPIAWMTAVKDRIRWLSRALDKTQAQLVEARAEGVRAGKERALAICKEKTEWLLGIDDHDKDKLDVIRAAEILMGAIHAELESIGQPEARKSEAERLDAELASIYGHLGRTGRPTPTTQAQESPTPATPEPQEWGVARDYVRSIYPRAWYQHHYRSVIAHTNPESPAETLGTGNDRPTAWTAAALSLAQAKVQERWPEAWGGMVSTFGEPPYLIMSGRGPGCRRLANANSEALAWIDAARKLDGKEG